MMPLVSRPVQQGFSASWWCLPGGDGLAFIAGGCRAGAGGQVVTGRAARLLNVQKTFAGQQESRTSDRGWPRSLAWAAGPGLAGRLRPGRVGAQDNLALWVLLLPGRVLVLAFGMAGGVSGPGWCGWWLTGITLSQSGKGGFENVHHW
jgi:hypothetical protein